MGLRIAQWGLVTFILLGYTVIHNAHGSTFLNSTGETGGAGLRKFRRLLSTSCSQHNHGHRARLPACEYAMVPEVNPKVRTAGYTRGGEGKVV